jgi:hypothetical protein
MAVPHGRSTWSLEARGMNPRNYARGAAYGYGGIGIIYLGLLGFALSVIWTGPWSEFLSHLRAEGGAVAATFGLLVGGHVLLVSLALSYLRNGRILRVTTLTIAVVLALWNIGGVVRLLRGSLGVSTTPELAPTLLLFKAALCVVYCACAYSLWRAGRASNYRLERP